MDKKKEKLKKLAVKILSEPKMKELYEKYQKKYVALTSEDLDRVYRVGG